MLKKISMLLLAVTMSSGAIADEGMWLLTQLKQNESRMKELGLKVSANSLADSLSQAIILFNGNGTASFISSEGLVLTNYHCARTGIQKASSDEHNYLRDGFWAASRKEEIPLDNVSMSINKVIKDVSGEVNSQLKKVGKDRVTQYNVITQIANRYKKRYPGMQARIRSYRNNTLHVLYITQTFNDVRLVGAPPIEIAKFGGETDNWTWPRHGCDFALLRAYVSKDGKSTHYSKDNVPYRPKVFLKVSGKGFSEGDYAMSMGYPGFTDRKATSMQIWERRNAMNPPLVKIRTQRQEILQKFMRSNESINIKYAEKFASSANYCKNYSGMNEWIDRLDLCRKKKAEENRMVENCKDEATRQQLKTMMADMEKGIKAAARYRTAQEYYFEVFNEGCDMIRFITSFSRAMKSMERANFVSNTKGFYKNYSEEVDKEVTKALIKVMIADLDDDLLTPFMLKLKASGDQEAVSKYVDNVYRTSVFANPEKVLRAYDNADFKIEDDAAYIMASEIEQKKKELYKLVESKRHIAQTALHQYYRIINSNDKEWGYPDADKSIRLSYGTVCGLKLDNGTEKPWHTTLAGVMEKAKSDNPDYKLPERLRQMWAQKDFGRYDTGDDVPACFITNGDVTGGNSGSPMLNAQGEVTGLVFDCNWESMLRDFDFNIDLHRVICLDIRYLMFIVEKYAGAKHIADEIKI